MTTRTRRKKHAPVGMGLFGDTVEVEPAVEEPAVEAPQPPRQRESCFYFPEQPVIGQEYLFKTVDMDAADSAPDEFVRAKVLGFGYDWKSRTDKIHLELPDYGGARIEREMWVAQPKFEIDYGANRDGWIDGEAEEEGND